MKMKILTPAEIQTLSTYNAEKARGIVHTPEWAEEMAELQAQFNCDWGDLLVPKAPR